MDSDVQRTENGPDIPEVVRVGGKDITGKDISSEQFREYVYGDGRVFTVDRPAMLFIVGGSHRVIDIHGMTHRPERNSVGIRWKARPGQPLFVA